MLNRWWLPEGEHLRIIPSPFSSIDLEEVDLTPSPHRRSITAYNFLLTPDWHYLSKSLFEFSNKVIFYQVLIEAVLNLSCADLG